MLSDWLRPDVYISPFLSLSFLYMIREVTNNWLVEKINSAWMDSPRGATGIVHFSTPDERVWDSTIFSCNSNVFLTVLTAFNAHLIVILTPQGSMFALKVKTAASLYLHAVSALPSTVNNEASPGVSSTDQVHQCMYRGGRTLPNLHPPSLICRRPAVDVCQVWWT